MATFNVNNLDELKRKIIRDQRVKVNQIFRDKDLRREIGQIVVDDIRSRRLGTPKASTLSWRRVYEKFNKLDSSYNRNIINATFTGELLNDLIKNVKAVTTKRQFVVAHSGGKHKKYSGKNGKIGSQSPYTEIQKGLKKLGYDYLSITDKALNKIQAAVRKKLLEILT